MEQSLMPIQQQEQKEHVQNKSSWDMGIVTMELLNAFSLKKFDSNRMM